MKEVHLAVGILAISVNTVAAVFGTWLWWRAQPSVWFWRVLRAGQLIVVVQAALGGVLAATGHKPHGLHVLYGVLPLLVAFLAEQLRVSSAQMVLDQRGYESAQEVGELPEEEQQSVVVAIVQRELGVMALAAIVIVGLLARAATTA